MCSVVMDEQTRRMLDSYLFPIFCLVLLGLAEIIGAVLGIWRCLAGRSNT